MKHPLHKVSTTNLWSIRPQSGSWQQQPAEVNSCQLGVVVHDLWIRLKHVSTTNHLLDGPEAHLCVLCKSERTK